MFHNKRHELPLLHGCILWGTRVVVPLKLQQPVLEELYLGHPCMSRMKRPVRMYVWWLKLDAHIEDLVCCCECCQSVQSMPPLAPLQPWSWPTRAWSWPHTDFAAPFLGKMFLVICTHKVDRSVHDILVDIIKELRSTFARLGLPEM